MIPCTDVTTKQCLRKTAFLMHLTYASGPTTCPVLQRLVIHDRWRHAWRSCIVSHCSAKRLHDAYGASLVHKALKGWKHWKRLHDRAHPRELPRSATLGIAFGDFIKFVQIPSMKYGRKFSLKALWIVRTISKGFKAYWMKFGHKFVRRIFFPVLYIQHSDCNKQRHLGRRKSRTCITE